MNRYERIKMALMLLMVVLLLANICIPMVSAKAKAPSYQSQINTLTRQVYALQVDNRNLKNQLGYKSMFRYGSVWYNVEDFDSRIKRLENSR